MALNSCPTLNAHLLQGVFCPHLGWKLRNLASIRFGDHFMRLCGSMALESGVWAEVGLRLVDGHHPANRPALTNAQIPHLMKARSFVILIQPGWKILLTNIGPLTTLTVHLLSPFSLHHEANGRTRNSSPACDKDDLSLTFD